MNYTEPDTIYYTVEDVIYVEIQKEMFFEEAAISSQPEQLMLFIEENKASYSSKLSMQTTYSDQLMETIKYVAQNTEDALKVFLSTNIVLSVFTTVSLQLLWGMINTLQIIVLTNLFNFKNIPLNAEMVMQAILRLCSLEFIDTSKF